MNKKIGLPSVIAIGTGVVVATSCLLTIGQGSGMVGEAFILSMLIGFVINCFYVSSVAELNALMPNLTGGLAQHTLASFGRFATIIVIFGAYLVGGTIVGSVECAMFGNAFAMLFPDLGLPHNFYSIAMLCFLIFVNFNGVNVFSKVQNLVAYGLIFSVVSMGLIGLFEAGTGEVVVQSMPAETSISSAISLAGMSFFLFIGSEMIIPVSARIKNSRYNVLRGMLLSLIIIFVMQTILILGIKNYIPWGDLSASASPHLLYGSNLLGKVGMIWMIIVTIFAVISTANSNVSGLSYLAQGMAKLDLLPSCFNKINNKKAPFIAILTFGGSMIVINLFDLSSASNLIFLVLCVCVFTMISYMLVHINVILLRKRLPKVPRTYKSPFGISIQILGVLSMLWMLWNIDPSIDNKIKVFVLTGVVMFLIGLYAFIWLKYVVKKPLFQPVAIKDVMAMENEMYFIERNANRKQKLESKLVQS